MTTQKTITIGRRKYTSSKLRSLPSFELNDVDVVATTPDGEQIAYRLHSTGVAVLNYGAVQKPTQFGGVVAFLAI